MFGPKKVQALYHGISYPPKNKAFYSLSQWMGLLPPVRQHHQEKGAQRYTQMPTVERSRMKRQFERWQRLPQEKQERIRQRFQTFRQLLLHKRQTIREKRRWFKNLPPDRQNHLRVKWKRLPPEKRQQLRNRWENQKNVHLGLPRDGLTPDSFQAHITAPFPESFSFYRFRMIMIV